jgi:FkbM family methyltransferase
LGLNRVEPHTLPLFVEFAKNSRGTLDIGANTGIYSILAGAANPAGRVIAWEPAPYLAAKLRANIDVNGFGDSVEAREAAVANRDGEAEFFISSETTMSSLSVDFAESGIHSSTKTKVRVERVDGVVPADMQVDLMKVDVEGYEFEALSGARETIKRCRPRVFFECLPATPSQPIEALFRELNYTIHRIAGGETVEMRSIVEQRSEDHNYLAISA